MSSMKEASRINITSVMKVESFVIRVMKRTMLSCPIDLFIRVLTNGAICEALLLFKVSAFLYIFLVSNEILAKNQ